MTTELMEGPETFVSSGDDMKQYLSEIRQYPLLTPEEERELARRCAAGDKAAIQKMVNSNLRLVVSVAKEYAGRGVPVMDLVQDGSIGLLAAVKKFDYTRELRFSTYATKWIRQGVYRCLASHDLIRVPDHTAERIRKIKNTKQALLQESGTEPTLEEIAEKCEMTVEKVRQLLQLDPEFYSLNATTGPDEDTSFADMVENLEAEQPYATVVRDALKETMDSLLGALTERQSLILRLHFGMEDGTCYSLEQIGKRLDISKERARQIKQQAIEKLLRLGSGMGLEDFLE